MREKVERVIMFAIVVALFVTMAVGLVVIADKMVLGAAMILIPLTILLIFSEPEEDTNER
jgi:hypothetical protein